LDSEVKGRKPTERPHRKVAGAAVMDGELFYDVLKGEEGMAGAEMFLVLLVAAFYLAVKPGRVGMDQFVADAESGGSALKKRSRPFLLLKKRLVNS